MERVEKPHAEFKEATELRAMAAKLRDTQDAVRHIDPDEIIFLSEMETTTKAMAKCYALIGHPISLFTNARFCIVFYESNIDYFTPDQRAILLLHELMHIPETGDKLIDHNVKDFRTILELGVDWSSPGVKVPRLIGGKENGKDDKAKRGKRGTKTDRIQANGSRKKNTGSRFKSRS